MDPEPDFGPPVLLADLAPVLEISHDSGDADESSNTNTNGDSPQKIPGTPISAAAVPSSVGGVPMFNPNTLKSKAPVIPDIPAVPSNGPSNGDSFGGTPESPTTTQVHDEPPPPCPSHWFFQHASGGWVPFSQRDSSTIEDGYNILKKKSDAEETRSIATDGGRYDVDVAARLRIPVYWDLPPNQVRRATWHIGHDGDLIPFTEEDATMIETEYVEGCLTNRWPKRVDLDSGETVDLRSKTLFVYYASKDSDIDDAEPRIVKRGFFDEMEWGENPARNPDHLVIVVPGPLGERPQLSSLGFAHADNRQGSIVDCVDTIRSTSLDILGSHFETSEQSKSSGRVEYLPIVWNHRFDAENEEEEKHVDRVMLDSISNLRKFATKAILEFVACTQSSQEIVDKIVTKINLTLQTFRERFPKFHGGVSLVGYSVGGCILYDILAHQGELPPQTEKDDGDAEPAKVEIEDTDDEEEPNQEEPGGKEEPQTVETLLNSIGMDEYTEKLISEDIDMDALKDLTSAELGELGITLGHRKIILSGVKNLINQSKTKEAERQKAKEAALQAKRERRLERRLAAALAAEKNAKSKQQQAQHPARPQIQYPTLDVEPHSFFTFGAPLGLVLSIRPSDMRLISKDFRLPTCDHVFNVFHPYDPLAYRLEPLVNPSLNFKEVEPVLVPHHQGRKRIHLELKGYLQEASKDLKKEVKQWAGTAWSVLKQRIGVEDESSPLAGIADDMDRALAEDPPTPTEGKPIETGNLNAGGRIDFVLQENPLDIINEQLFSLRAHSSYWTSEDATLFLLTKIYDVEFSPSAK